MSEVQTLSDEHTKGGAPVEKPRQKRKRRAKDAAPKPVEQQIVDGVLCHKEGEAWIPYTSAELTSMVQGLSQLAQNLATKSDHAYAEGKAVAERNMRVRLGLDVKGVDS